MLVFLLSCVSSQFVHTEMKAYRLYTVVPRLVEFIEQLTNCYVRLNRNRLKGSEGAESARAGENGEGAASCLVGLWRRPVHVVAPLIRKTNLPVLVQCMTAV